MRTYLLVAMIGAMIPVWAQTPAFDVASVKFTSHGRTADGWSHSSVDAPSPGNFTATNASLGELIRWAYEVKEYQISGPTWLNDDAESFDIAAKAPSQTSKAQIRLMVQSLLAERFKLALHRETKMLPMYELVVNKGGSKLQPAAPDGKGGWNSQGGNESVRVTSPSMSMATLAYFLSRQVDRPVYDKTELTGTYAISLEYGKENDPSGRPSLFTALQEKLGLKLEGTKGPVEILVVDRIEKAPTEN